MRLCASLFRGVAAPLGRVIFFQFCRNCSLYALRLGLSACARHGRYHYPRRALRAAEMLGARLSKRLFAVFWGQVAIIDSSGAKCVPFFTKTAAVHGKQPRFLSVKGTGAVLRHFMERARNAAICALVQVALGSNLPLPMPVVMPFSTAQATACA